MLGRDIRDGTILEKDISPAALGGLEGPRGEAGPAGPVGPAGPAGTLRVDVVGDHVRGRCASGHAGLVPGNPECPDVLESASVTLVRRDDGEPVNGRFYVMFE